MRYKSSRFVYYFILVLKMIAKSLEARGWDRRVALAGYPRARHCARWDSICLLTAANVTVLRLSSGIKTSLLLFYYTF